ncbi:MAG: hypothetical protein KatS3mg002_0701 [Candidatus Woesearchaeota archaeon]|nr:MAG: hypothetical protein KatS3mg002_0701 [Candidatus Woesearchaeota archaeon]
MDTKNNILTITSAFVALFLVYYYKSIGLLILLFLTENIIIGFFNVLRMASCGQNPFGKIIFIPFFIFHYGIFLIIYYLLIKFFLKWISESNTLNYESISTILFFIIALILINGIKFIIDEISGNLKDKSPHEFTFRPYSKLILTTLSVILGSLIYVGLKKQEFMLFFIVLLKLIIEIYSENMRNET